MRNEDPPLWQTAPKEWEPIKVVPQATSTVVGGRAAKREQTVVVVQGPYHLQIDQEYADNRKGGAAYVPLCHDGAKGPYLDVRVYRALVFLFQIQT